MNRRALSLRLGVVLCAVMCLHALYSFGVLPGLAGRSGGFLLSKDSVVGYFEQAFTARLHGDVASAFVEHKRRFQTTLDSNGTRRDLQNLLTTHFAWDRELTELHANWSNSTLSPFAGFHIATISGILFNRYMPKNSETFANLLSAAALTDFSVPMNDTTCISKRLGAPTSACLTTDPISLRTCAVVGNGRILLHRKDGRDIDRHSLVFRFNQAPLKGYEKHVGSRTDIRFVHKPKAYYKSANGFRLPPAQSHEIRMYRLNPHVPPVKFPKKSKTVDKLFRKAKKRRGVRQPFIVSPLLEHAAFTLLGYDVNAPSERCSVGIIGIIAALSICDTVDLYGFDSREYQLLRTRSDGIPVMNGGRYFDIEETKYVSPHSWDREQILIYGLEQLQLVKVHSWSIM